jgi:hypothetical protein
MLQRHYLETNWLARYQICSQASAIVATYGFLFALLKFSIFNYSLTNSRFYISMLYTARTALPFNSSATSSSIRTQPFYRTPKHDKIGSSASPRCAFLRSNFLEPYHTNTVRYNETRSLCIPIISSVTLHSHHKSFRIRKTFAPLPSLLF